MSYEIEFRTGFKRDFKRALKRGLPEEKLEEVIKLLRSGDDFPPKYKKHKLKGDYSGLWECHIQPDWLLIWSQDDTIRLISLVRTGSHSDLF